MHIWHDICAYFVGMITIFTSMRKILLLLCVAFCITGRAQEPVIVTVTAPSWGKVYAWVWNCPKQYCDRFIPLTKTDDNTWTLSLDMDLAAYKKAGMLFVDTDSWNTDLQKTNDLHISNACYAIPQTQEKGQLVQRPNGLVCKELIYECKKVDCK